MFFCAYLGDRDHEREWLRAVTRHAAWLGLTAHMQSRPIADGRVFSFGWLSAHAPDGAALIRERGGLLTLSTLETRLPPGDDLTALTGFEPGVALLQVSLQTGEVEAVVPAAPTEKLFAAPRPDGYAWSTDLRLLLRWAGIELHEAGVYALFEHETTPLTLTLSRTVQQIPLGHRWRLPAGGGAPVLTVSFRWPETPPDRPSSSSLEQTRDILDRAVAEAEIGSMVAFSGDTDSALLAARLAALGRSDVTLIHFATDAGHPRAQRARQIAEHLHMPFELVVWRPEDFAGRLHRLAREYSFPFGDMAVVPTLMLIDAASAHQPPALVDGSGTEILNPSGLHYGKWQRIYRIPMPVRAAVGSAFPLGLWKSTSKRARLADSMRTTLRAPLSRLDYYGPTHATGVAYTVPPAVRKELEAITQARFDALQAGLSALHRASISRMHGLGLTVARTADPLRTRGIRPLYPFLRPELLQLCAGLSFEEMNPGRESKGLWKTILAENVPREWIDQPRAGFPMPYQDAFAHPAMVQFLNDAVLAPCNPLIDYCHKKRVRQIASRMGNGQPVSGGMRRFLWTLTFASAWLTRLDSELRTQD